jgi:esterase/lipase superfamily enzyme
VEVLMKWWSVLFVCVILSACAHVDQKQLANKQKSYRVENHKKRIVNRPARAPPAYTPFSREAACKYGIVSGCPNWLPEGVTHLQLVYFATNRTPVDDEERFSAERNMTMLYGRASVSVPRSHVLGKVERPSFNYLKWAYTDEIDDQHFKIQYSQMLSSDEFVNKLKASEDSVLLYIHGFNSSFKDAIYQAAQIAYDANYTGHVLVFSWPSKGSLFGYKSDVISANFSETDLGNLLRTVSSEIAPKRLFVVVHSLGNQILVNALQQVALSKAPLKIDELVMAAPDLSKDVFLKKVDDIRAVAPRMTIYASAVDRALQYSEKQSLDGKLGYISGGVPKVIKNIDTIDVTVVGDDFLGANHSSYAESRAVLTDLGLLISDKEHREPIVRTPTLKLRTTKENLKYWSFPK